MKPLIIRPFQGRMPNICESSGLHPTLLNLSASRTFASFQTVSKKIQESAEFQAFTKCYPSLGLSLLDKEKTVRRAKTEKTDSMLEFP
jgi:hypothetical protein